MHSPADGTSFDSSGPSGVRGDEFELDGELELGEDSEIDYDVYDDDDVESEAGEDEDDEDGPDLDEFFADVDEY